MTLLWVEDGEDTRWIAEAIAGAFQKALVVNFEKLEKECFANIRDEALEQGIALVVVTKTALAMKKEFHEGLVLLPYGSKVKTSMNGVLVHRPSDKKNEKDLVVEETLAFLKKEKALLKM